MGRPIGVSAVQKGLHLSSPSLAQYHLRKLAEMGLVEERPEGYIVTKVVLKSFFRIRNIILPFKVFYAVFFAGSLITLLSILYLGSMRMVTSFEVVAIVVNVVAIVVSLYETGRTLRDMP